MSGLRDLVGDATAGDASVQDAKRVAEARISDPVIAREAVFWEGLRAGLAHRTDVPPADTRLADRVVAIQRQMGAQRRTRPAWERFALAASIGIAIGAVVTGLLASRPQPIPGVRGYGEDGAALVLPVDAQALRRGASMPLASITVVDASRPLPPLVGKVESKPWLGIWTQPVVVTHGGPFTEGHLIVRIAQGSPAAKVGLAPGDVILRIDGCAVGTPICVARALAKVKPNARIALDVWRGADASVSAMTVELERLAE